MEQHRSQHVESTHLNLKDDIMSSIGKGNRSQRIEDAKYALSLCEAIQVVCSVCSSTPHMTGDQ